MNQNQIIKALRLAEDAYANTDNYASILGRTPCIKLSLGKIQNMQDISKHWNDVMTGSVSMPWGSMLFDIRDYSIPNYLTGDDEVQNLGIHMQAISVDMNMVKIPLLLLQDWRATGKAVSGKTYMMYGDQVGMHTMCSVDSLVANGCNCYKQNVFSVNPAYALEIQNHTPCFRGDIGLALPDCSQYHPDCASTIVQKKNVTDLAKLIMAYVNLPSNALVRVTDTSQKGLKLSNVYYILVDEGQLARLSTGDDSAELEGNSFTDGSNLIMELEKPIFSPEFAPFMIGKKKYEVVIDKTRESPSDRAAGDEQDGSSMGDGVSQDAQSDATS